MKKLLMIFLLVGISVSFYSCGNDEDNTMHYYDLDGHYIYIVSGEIVMSTENESLKEDVKKAITYDGIYIYGYKDNKIKMSYCENVTSDDVNYKELGMCTLLDYKLIIPSETVEESKDGVKMHMTLNHGDATISDDKRTITWTTTISGIATNGDVTMTLSGSYTNKAVKE